MRPGMRKMSILAAFLWLFTIAALAAVPALVLPTGWSVGAPAGPVAATGTMPQGIALSPDASRVAVVESGAGPAGLRVYDSTTLTHPASVPLKGAFGKPVWDGNAHLWVALANAHGIGRISVLNATVERTIDTGQESWPAAIALSPDGARLAFSDDAGSQAAVIHVAKGSIENRIAPSEHPGDIAYSPDGTTIALTNRAGDSVLVWPASGSVPRKIVVGRHPSALAFSANSQTLWVALADDDAVVAIDVRSGHVLKKRSLSIASSPGVSPNSIAIARNGTLYVTCGAINALAILTPDGRVSRIATGWYPDGVAVDASTRMLYILNGKGERSRPNPGFDPFVRGSAGYVAASLTGSVRKVNLRNVSAALVPRPSAPTPAQARTLRPGGPIKHVIYIIKENRSYDQVLGDVSGGDGMASLVLFGEAVTPNQHAIVRRFGLFDRAFTNAQVSADGHNWTDAAFANDYLERFWPPLYAGRRSLYDFEDGAQGSVPHNGYLWDAAARAHVTYRNYGEFVTNPQIAGAPVTTQEANLIGHTARNYPGFDMEISDLDRYAIWLREFHAYEKAGALPALEIIRLPNDHTAGTRPGAPTPQAFVAQNDLAFGRILEAVSHSKFWRSTAIFSVEDDAQNGPDHVDDQRSTYYLASPYARGGVNHTHYSTASVVRTIELILGLPALSTYDAAATPMYAAFSALANFAPYSAILPSIDLHAVNKRTAYGAQRSARMDFRHADAADAGQLHDILYHASSPNT